MAYQLALVQPVSWDRVYEYNISDFNNLNKDDYVVVETQLGLSLGKILEIKEIDTLPQNGNSQSESDPIIRKANDTDIMNYARQAGVKDEAMKFCKNLVRKLNLPMKLMDVYISVDDKRYTFAFIADGRVDFREMVKELAQHFQKSIRLQQIGVRDETKFSSDIGVCGQQTCCSRFLDELGNVNATYAEMQEVSHRGADRLSGVCGRLACCLKYEQKMYEQESSKFPAVGTKVKLKTGVKATVNTLHLIRRTIDVTPDGQDTPIEVQLSDIR